MLTRRWIDTLRDSISQTRRASKRIRKSGVRSQGTEGLEDRTLLVGPFTGGGGTSSGGSSAPYSGNDTYTVTSGQTLSVNAPGVLTNDTSGSGGSLTAQIMSSPSIGTLTLSSNGSFTYIAPSAYVGSASFTYRAFNGAQFGNTATVSINVTSGSGGGGGGGGGGGTNQPPVPLADSFFVERSSSNAKLPVLWNDTDPNSNPLSITSTTTPVNGSASIQMDFMTGRQIVAYTPSTGYLGSDTFNYTISDGMATASTTTTLTVHQSDNTISQARSLSLQTNVRATTGGIIGDGTQPSSDVDLFAVTLNVGDVIKIDVDSVRTDSGGSFGSLNSRLRLFNSLGTQVAVNDNGTDPDTGVASNDPYLIYTVTSTGMYYIGVSESGNASYNPNSTGTASSMQSGPYLLQVLKEVPNLPPTAVADSVTTHMGVPIDVAVLSNDSDPNGDAISITSPGSPANGSAQIVTVGGVQRIRYTPSAGFVGSNSFTYTISDTAGATASSTVTVSVTNQAPVATSESYEAVAGVVRSVTAPGLLANDSDPDGDALTVVLVTGVSNGTLSLNANGSFTYTATAGFSGTDSFVYRVTDGGTQSSNATVTLSVYPSNVTAFPESYSVGHGKTLVVPSPGVLGNDWDFERQALSATLVTAPANGSLTLNANGSFAYIPNSGFVGADSFVYRATDGVNQSANVTVPIQVTNFAPWTVNDYFTVSHDRPLIRTATNGILSNDVDVEDDPLTITLVSGPASGTLSLNPDGAFTFTPAAGMTGNVSFVYKISDGHHFSQNATATINVVNSAPVANSDLLSTATGSALLIEPLLLLSNDFDADGDATTLMIGATTQHGTLTPQAGGGWLYVPATGFTGTDEFSYSLSDSLISGNTTTVRIRVNNEAPLGIADFYSSRHDRVLTVGQSGVVANDLDDDGDALTVILDTAPATGVLQLNTNGTFVYTPVAGATGEVTFKYRVTDGIAVSDPVTATIQLTNAAPVARSDSYHMHQGTALTVAAADGVLSNDRDSDDDLLTLTLVTNVSGGTLTMVAGGAFTYVPNAGFSGTDSFTYRISDGLVTTAPVTVTLNVTNSVPVASADNYSVVHDRLLNVSASEGVLKNDFDVDGDVFTASLVTQAAHGFVTLNAAGSFNYQPNFGYSGSDSFTYRIFDGASYSQPITATINVTNVKPWALDRSFLALHDQPIQIDAPGLFAFSGDSDGDVLSIALKSQPSRGTVTLLADGSFNYTPAAGFVGLDSFRFQMSDGIAVSDEQTVTINVFNSAPLAVSDYYGVTHDKTLTVGLATGLLANDYDGNNDTLTVSLVSGQGPAHGTLSLSANGTFTYVPNAAYAGLDGFRYRITDGAAVSEAEVTLVVRNDRAIAVSDRYGVIPGGTLSVPASEGVLYNDIDADADVLQAVLISGTSHGTLTLNSSGAFTYTPNVGFVGIDEFRYQAKDNGNLFSFTQTVYISTALAATNDEFIVSHDRGLSGNVYANDFNAYSGSPFSVQIVTQPSHGTIQFNPGGTFTYQPQPGFTGQTSFTYQIFASGNASNVATATIDVVNEAPLVFTGTWREAHGRTITTTAATGLNSRAMDRDNDALTFAIVTNPAHGTVTLQPDGSFVYVPTSSAYVGLDSFTWKTFDGLAWSAVSTATIQLTNAKPMGGADSYQIHSGTTLTVTAAQGLLANDSDLDGDPLSVSLDNLPSHGTLTLTASGAFTYVPNAGVINAEETIVYRISDGAEFATGILKIVVSNAKPRTGAAEFRMQHSKTLTVPASAGLLSGSGDSDGDSLTVHIQTQPQHGTLTASPDGSFSYAPAAGWTGTATFTYRLFDGLEYSNSATASIEVQNSSATARNDWFSIRRNQTLSLATSDFLRNDSDVNADTLSLQITSSPANGTLTSTGTGTWLYVPNSTFAGTDTFRYRLNDGASLSPEATVEIEVRNAAPIAANDEFEVVHGRSLTIPAGRIQANDIDPDGDSVSVALASGVRHGSLTLLPSGQFTYTPDTGFVGRDSFSYRLNDGLQFSDPIQVVLDVANNRPIARDSSVRMTHDSTLNILATEGLLTLASDQDSDLLTAVVVSTVKNGTLTIAPDGGWSYSPNAHFVGNDSFTYRVSDGSLSSTTKTVAIEVVNTVPAAAMDAYRIASSASYSVAAPGVLANDSDIDQDSLQLTIMDETKHGALTLLQNGAFNYVPTSGFTGEDSFTYRIYDGIDYSNATVYLSVGTFSNTTQSLPTARNDFYSTKHSTTLTLDAAHGLLVNDSNGSGGVATAQIVTQPSSGTLTLNPTGSFVYVPNAAFTGNDSFTYRISNTAGQSGIATANISVVNSLPWAQNAAFETRHGTTIASQSGQLVRFTGDRDDDVLSHSLVAGPANGILTLNSNGTFSYAPNSGFTGTDTFSYRVFDGVGYGNTAIVSLDVTNDRPVVSDQEFRTRHGAQYQSPARGVLARATDRNNDSLTAQLVVNAAHGTVVLQPDGTFTYSPNTGFSGSDQFTFRVYDGAESSFDAIVKLRIENNSPVAIDTKQSLNHGDATVLPLRSMDKDGDEIVYELVTGPLHGTLSYENLLSNGNNGTPMRFSGAVTFQPAAGYVGNDTIRYRAYDGVDFSEPAEVALVVRNSAPKANSTAVRTIPGRQISSGNGSLFDLASDADGDTLSLSIVTLPTSGTLILEQENGRYTGKYTYTPNSGFAGNDSFTWRVFDGATYSTASTVQIAVQNQSPKLMERSFTRRFGEGTPGSQGLRTYTIDLRNAALAFDGDGDPVQFHLVGASAGTATINSSGVLQWTSASATFTGSASITITASDPYSQSDSSTIVLNIDNSAPQAADNFFSVKHHTLLTLSPAVLTGNDFDFDGDAMQIVSLAVSPGAQGTVAQNGANWVFNPGNFVGTTTLTYVVSDGLVNSDPATIEIEVTNIVAWALQGTVRTSVNGTASINLLDSSAGLQNPDGDQLSVVVTVPPQHGSLTPGTSGTFTYNRNANYSGADSFRYRLSDGVSLSEEIEYRVEPAATISGFSVGSAFQLPATDGSMDPTNLMQFDLQQIAVTYHDTAPLSVNDSTYRFNHGFQFQSQKELNMPQPWQNDYDPDGTPISSPTLSYNGTGGPRSLGFTYQALSGGVLGNSAQVVASVGNLPPVGYGWHSKIRPPQGSYQAEPLIQDPEGDTVTPSVVNNVQHGTLQVFVNQNGVVYIVYTPFQNLVLATYVSTGPFSGHFVYNNYFDNVPWSVTDQYGATTSGTYRFVTTADPNFRWNVVEARNDKGSWYGPAATGNVLSNDYSADGDPLHVQSYTVLPGSAAGSFSIASNGQYTFTPDDPYAFAASGARASYVVADNFGNQSVGVLEVSLRTLRPGEAVGHEGVSVVNGEKYSGTGVYENGLDEFGVWIGGGAAHLYLAPQSVNKITVYGGQSIVEGGSPHQLWLDSDGSVSMPGVGSITHAIISSKFGSLPDVSADTVRLSAGVNIGAVSAKQVYRVSAGQDVSSVTAEHNVYHVNAGRDLGQVTATSGYVVSVNAGRDASGVSSAKWINRVHAGNDLTGSVSASSGGIGIDGAGGISGVGGVSAGRDILGEVSATKAITSVMAGRDIVGKVSNTGGTQDHIYLVTATTGSVLGGVSASGSIAKVTAGLHVRGGIDGQNIGYVSAGREISGKTKAVQELGIVSAGTNIIGDIEAGGSIISVSAGSQSIQGVVSGYISNKTITAGLHIGSITASHSVGATDSAAGSITSTEGIRAAGFLRRIYATGFIHADMKASLDVGAIEAGTDIEGDVTSEAGAIFFVGATNGKIEGDIKAQLNVGTVIAYTDRIGQTTATSGAIRSVTATRGKIDGEISGDKGIGLISAGTDIKGNVTTAIGSIGRILAGTFTAGDITAEQIHAGLNIGRIYARDQAAEMEEETKWYYMFDPSKPLIEIVDGEIIVNKPPKPPALPHGTKGNISAEISAGARIGKVLADGNISSGEINAGTSINAIGAVRDLEANVTSYVGALQLFAGGSLEGSQTATGTIYATAYGDISGSLTSRDRGLVVGTYEDVTATLSATRAIGVAAYGSLTGAAKSTESVVIGFAMDAVTLTGSFAKRGMGVGSLGKLYVDASIPEGPGVFSSVKDTVLRLDYSLFYITDRLRGIHKTKAFGNVDAIITGAETVEIVGWQDVTATISAEKNITVNALGDASFPSLKSAKGSIYAAASSIDGKVETKTQSTSMGLDAPDGGNIVLRAYGENGAIDPSGEVTRSGGSVDVVADAAKRISVGAWSDVSGSLTSALSMAVLSYADISATISAGKEPSFDYATDIFAGGDILATITAGSTAHVTAMGSITKQVEVSFGTIDNLSVVVAKRQNAVVTAGGSITGGIKAFGDVNVFAGLGISGGAIAAGDDAYVEAGEIVSSDITAGAARANVDDNVAGVLATDDDYRLHVATIVAHAGLVGQVAGIHAVDIASFGNVTGQLTSAEGPVLVSALPHVISASGTAPRSDTPSNVTGIIHAGKYVEVRASGNVTSNKIIAGDSVFVAAHGSISGIERITATKGVIDLSADKSIQVQMAFSEEGTFAEAVDNISGEFSAATGSVSLWAGGSVSASVVAASGFASVSAIGDVTKAGEVGVDGHLGVSITAFGSISDIETIANDGDIDIVAMGSVTGATADASGDVSVLSVGNITGKGPGGASESAEQKADFNSRGGAVSLYSLDALASLSAAGKIGVSAYAALDISNAGFSSSEGDVGLLSSGTSFGTITRGAQTITIKTLENASISADVNAKGAVSVAALGGSVSGSVRSTASDVDVLARDIFSGKANGAIYASVTAGSGIGGSGSTISGGAHVSTTTFGGTDATITSKGSIDIFSGMSLVGSVTGNTDISVAVLTGTSSADIWSMYGSVEVFAGGSVESDVTAALNASVAAVGDVSGDITTAFGNIQATTFGTVSGDIAAGLDADVMAVSGIEGNVAAQRDTSIGSFGDSSGTISAGRDVWISLAGNLTGSSSSGRNTDAFLDQSTASMTAGAAIVVTALSEVAGPVVASGGDAVIWAGGSVINSTTASDDVVITTWGSHLGSASAGKSAYIFTGNGGHSTVSSGLDFVYISWGAATIFGFSGRDAVVVSAGSINGPVNAARDIYAAGLSNVQLQLNAGRDLGAFARETFFGVNTFAGRDAVVIAGGNYNSGLMAGRDGFVYTFGSAIGSVYATEYAGAVIWGVAAGPFVVSGNDGAFVANIGGYNGSVTSADGSAGVIEMGQFVGSVTAGEDAWMIGEGSLYGSVSGQQDAGVGLYGNITGSVSAGRDAWAFTYASLNGTVSAGRDLTGIYAKGDIDGSLIAERNISGGIDNFVSAGTAVLSHGTIDASINATGTSSFDGSGGTIGNIVAWGRIDGAIAASQSIASVRSADLIGAIITAPSVGSVIQNDATVLTQYPMPVIPDSILPGLYQYRSETLAAWEAQATEIFAKISETKAAVADAILEIRNQLQQSRADLDHEALVLGELLALDRIVAQRAFQAELDHMRYAMIDGDKEVLDALLELLAEAKRERQAMIDTGNQAYAAAVVEAEKVAAEFSRKLQELLEALAAGKQAFDDEARRDRDWWGQVFDMGFETFLGMLPLYRRIENWNGILDDLYESGIENGMELNEFEFKLLNSIPILSDIAIMWESQDGRDPWTLQKISMYDRVLIAVRTIYAGADLGHGILSVYNRFTSPCRSWTPGTICFVGDTKVLVARLPSGSSNAMAGANGDDPESISLGAVCLLIGLGCAVTAYAVGNQIPVEPKRRRVLKKHRKIDDLFSRGEPLNLLDDHFSDESTLRRSAEHQSSENLAVAFLSSQAAVGQGFNTNVVEDLGGRDLPSSNHQTRASENAASRLSESLKPKPSNRDFVSRGLGVIAAVLLAVGGLFTTRDLATSQPQQLVAAVEAPAKTATPQYLSKDIRELQVMQDRVLADNPLEDETESPLGEIVPSEWRVVRLEHTEPNGTRHIIERGMPLDDLTTVTARPSSSIDSWQPGDPLPEYFDESGFPIDPSVVAAMLAERSAAGDHAEAGLPTEPLTVGSTVFVDLPEHGISGNFTITEIRPCATPNPGDGCLVTTKFIHENAEILDLRIEGSAEAIGTTASHPFWSEDRQQFVAAGELRIGENLLLADDSIRRVESLTRRETRETVYNIEVDGEHVFYVGGHGVLVHNECWSTARKNFWKKEARMERLRTGRFGHAARWSANNLARMREGLAPRFKADVINRSTGIKEFGKEFSYELHHRYLPQRSLNPFRHKDWNLQIATPWDHELLDIFRHVGYDLMGPITQI